MTKQEYRQKVEEILNNNLTVEQMPKYEATINIFTVNTANAIDELVSLYEETPGFPVTGKDKAIPGSGGVSKPDSVGEGNVTGFCHFLEMQEDLEAYKTMELAFPYNLQELLKRYLKTQPTKDSRDSNKLNGSEEK